MKQNYTHICLVIDASGSMKPIADALRIRLNECLNGLYCEQGTRVVDIHQFSDELKDLAVGVEVGASPRDFLADYVCGGHTAINDAVCTTIDRLGVEFNRMNEDERPDRVVFIVVADGIDNTSQKYTSQSARDRIIHQTTIYSWRFLLAVTGMDPQVLGDAFGIGRERQIPFDDSEAGVATLAQTLTERIRNGST